MSNNDQPSGFRHTLTVDQQAWEEQMGVVMGHIEDLKGSQMTPESVALAMKQGLQLALADPATWASASQGAKANAEAHAGRFLFKMLMAFLRKVLTFTIVGLMVYNLGGWSALVSVWKTTGVGKP